MTLNYYRGFYCNQSIYSFNFRLLVDFLGSYVLISLVLYE